MKYFLTKDEFFKFANHIALGSDVDDQHLFDKIELCKEWSASIATNSWVLSRYLLNKKKTGYECNKLIDRIYKTVDQMYFHIEEMDANFIDYVIKSIREPDLELEEQLSDLQQAYKR